MTLCVDEIQNRIEQVRVRVLAVGELDEPCSDDNADDDDECDENDDDV